MGIMLEKEIYPFSGETQNMSGIANSLHEKSGNRERLSVVSSQAFTHAYNYATFADAQAWTPESEVKQQAYLHTIAQGRLEAGPDTQAAATEQTASADAALADPIALRNATRLSRGRSDS